MSSTSPLTISVDGGDVAEQSTSPQHVTVEKKTPRSGNSRSSGSLAVSQLRSTDSVPLPYTSDQGLMSPPPPRRDDHDPSKGLLLPEGRIPRTSDFVKLATGRPRKKLKTPLRSIEVELSSAEAPGQVLYLDNYSSPLTNPPNSTNKVFSATHSEEEDDLESVSSFDHDGNGALIRSSTPSNSDPSGSNAIDRGDSPSVSGHKRGRSKKGSKSSSVLSSSTPALLQQIGPLGLFSPMNVLNSPQAASVHTGPRPASSSIPYSPSPSRSNAISNSPVGTTPSPSPIPLGKKSVSVLSAQQYAGMGWSGQLQSSSSHNQHSSTDPSFFYPYLLAAADSYAMSNSGEKLPENVKQILAGFANFRELGASLSVSCPCGDSHSPASSVGSASLPAPSAQSAPPVHGHAGALGGSVCCGRLAYVPNVTNSRLLASIPLEMRLGQPQYSSAGRHIASLARFPELGDYFISPSNAALLFAPLSISDQDDHGNKLSVFMLRIRNRFVYQVGLLHKESVDKVTFINMSSHYSLFAALSAAKTTRVPSPSSGTYMDASEVEEFGFRRLFGIPGQTQLVFLVTPSASKVAKNMVDANSGASLCVVCLSDLQHELCVCKGAFCGRLLHSYCALLKSNSTEFLFSQLESSTDVSMQLDFDLPETTQDGRTYCPDCANESDPVSETDGLVTSGIEDANKLAFLIEQLFGEGILTAESVSVFDILDQLAPDQLDVLIQVISLAAAEYSPSLDLEDVDVSFQDSVTLLFRPTPSQHTTGSYQADNQPTGVPTSSGDVNPPPSSPVDVGTLLRTFEPTLQMKYASHDIFLESLRSGGPSKGSKQPGDAIDHLRSLLLNSVSVLVESAENVSSFISSSSSVPADGLAGASTPLSHSLNSTNQSKSSAASNCVVNLHLHVSGAQFSSSPALSLAGFSSPLSPSDLSSAVASRAAWNPHLRAHPQLSEALSTSNQIPSVPDEALASVLASFVGFSGSQQSQQLASTLPACPATLLGSDIFESLFGHRSSVTTASHSVPHLLEPIPVPASTATALSGAASHVFSAVAAVHPHLPLELLRPALSPAVAAATACLSSPYGLVQVPRPAPHALSHTLSAGGLSVTSDASSSGKKGKLKKDKPKGVDINPDAAITGITAPGTPTGTPAGTPSGATPGKRGAKKKSVPLLNPEDISPSPVSQDRKPVPDTPSTPTTPSQSLQPLNSQDSPPNISLKPLDFSFNQEIPLSPLNATGTYMLSQSPICNQLQWSVFASAQQSRGIVPVSPDMSVAPQPAPYSSNPAVPPTAPADIRDILRQRLAGALQAVVAVAKAERGDRERDRKEKREEKQKREKEKEKENKEKNGKSAGKIKSSQLQSKIASPEPISSPADIQMQGNSSDSTITQITPTPDISSVSASDVPAIMPPPAVPSKGVKRPKDSKEGKDSKEPKECKETKEMKEGKERVPLTLLPGASLAHVRDLADLWAEASYMSPSAAALAAPIVSITNYYLKNNYIRPYVPTPMSSDILLQLKSILGPSIPTSTPINPSVTANGVGITSPTPLQSISGGNGSLRLLNLLGETSAVALTVAARLFAPLATAMPSFATGNALCTLVPGHGHNSINSGNNGVSGSVLNPQFILRRNAAQAVLKTLLHADALLNRPLTGSSSASTSSHLNHNHSHANSVTSGNRGPRDLSKEWTELVDTDREFVELSVSGQIGSRVSEFISRGTGSSFVMDVLSRALHVPRHTALSHPPPGVHGVAPSADRVDELSVFERRLQKLQLDHATAVSVAAYLVGLPPSLLPLDSNVIASNMPAVGAVSCVSTSTFAVPAPGSLSTPLSAARPFVHPLCAPVHSSGEANARDLEAARLAQAVPASLSSLSSALGTVNRNSSLSHPPSTKSSVLASLGRLKAAIAFMVSSGPSLPPSPQPVLRPLLSVLLAPVGAYFPQVAALLSNSTSNSSNSIGNSNSAATPTRQADKSGSSPAGNGALNHFRVPPAQATVIIANATAAALGAFCALARGDGLSAALLAAAAVDSPQPASARLTERSERARGSAFGPGAGTGSAGVGAAAYSLSSARQLFGSGSAGALGSSATAGGSGATAPAASAAVVAVAPLLPSNVYNFTSTNLHGNFSALINLTGSATSTGAGSNTSSSNSAAVSSNTPPIIDPVLSHLSTGNSAAAGSILVSAVLGAPDIDATTASGPSGSLSNAGSAASGTGITSVTREREVTQTGPSVSLLANSASGAFAHHLRLAEPELLRARAAIAALALNLPVLTALLAFAGDTLSSAAPASSTPQQHSRDRSERGDRQERATERVVERPDRERKRERDKERDREFSIHFSAESFWLFRFFATLARCSPAQLAELSYVARGAREIVRLGLIHPSSMPTQATPPIPLIPSIPLTTESPTVDTPSPMPSSDTPLSGQKRPLSSILEDSDLELQFERQLLRAAVPFQNTISRRDDPVSRQTKLYMQYNPPVAVPSLLPRDPALAFSQPSQTPGVHPSLIASRGPLGSTSSRGISSPAGSAFQSPLRAVSMPSKGSDSRLKPYSGRGRRAQPKFI